ncbi:helix-turn-helix domain-containing protein [Paenibacillus naphthalenovorans]|uniref:helix-turn-helix domain-containing protein n=1 Tax=Paenibacillus naphthalenovorans TaxID=162209 RepID=UPI003D28838B
MQKLTLREAREEAGFSLEAAAERSGYTVRQLKAIERDNSRTPWHVLLYLASLYSYPIGAIKLDKDTKSGEATLRSLRRDALLTQEQAAERIGISVRKLRAIEKDSSGLMRDEQLFTAFCDAYGVLPQYVYLGRESLSDSDREVFTARIAQLRKERDGIIQRFEHA